MFNPYPISKTVFRGLFLIFLAGALNVMHAQNCNTASPAVSQPSEFNSITALVRELLLEGKITQAIAALAGPLADQPRSVPLLTAQAEIFMRRGQPWLAELELKRAIEDDPCYARAHLARSRVLRLDSRYTSERKELQIAYEIDPNDVEIRRAWNRVVTPANDVVAIQTSLATTKDLDPEIREKAQESAHGLLSLLSENSQNCKVLSTERSGTLPLVPSMRDGKVIDAYKLRVQFPHSLATLKIDTAGSGLYISRALAELNDFKHEYGAPAGTVLVDRLALGPFEFHQCTVGVSDVPLPGDSEGSISTDLFADYLVTLDFQRARMNLAPLPLLTGPLPEDRSQAPELAGYSPVYHARQYLLIPVTLNKKERRLFVLDTGIRYTTMTLDVAHAVSKTKANFTNAAQTKSGATLQIYRDGFEFAYAGLERAHQDHVIEMDTELISQHVGMEVGGLLGFDQLHSMTMHLDYRDGLVKIESAEDDAIPHRRAEDQIFNAETANATGDDCPPPDATPSGITSAIVAKTTGFLDLHHAKVGQSLSLQVLLGWKTDECQLRPGDFIYGRVTSTTPKTATGTTISMAFNEGDCLGHGKKRLNLETIAVLAPPGEFKGVHTVMPTSIGGGKTRDIGTTVSNMGLMNDQNLNEADLPSQVKVGSVIGLSNLDLAPTGGPACSALLTSSDKNLRLGIGTRFVLLQQ